MGAEILDHWLIFFELSFENELYKKGTSCDVEKYWGKGEEDRNFVFSANFKRNVVFQH